MKRASNGVKNIKPLQMYPTPKLEPLSTKIRDFKSMSSLSHVVVEFNKCNIPFLCIDIYCHPFGLALCILQ